MSRVAVAARVLLVPYAIALGLIVWLPGEEASKATGIVFWFARFVSDLTGLPLAISSTVFEFLANIVLFVPLGLLLTLGWPRLKPWLVVLIGCASSITIELVQLAIPSRYSTVSDVIANTLGTAVGCGIGMLVVRALRTRRP